MDRTPYFDHLRLADIAVMDADDARAYLAERARASSPQYPAHGEPVGRILLELLGHAAEARLLHTGRHCRSFGIEIEGKVHGPMGIDRAFSLGVQRICSVRPRLTPPWPQSASGGAVRSLRGLRR